MPADLSFDEMRSIKVLVVPIGSNSLFDQQFQYLTKHTEIPLYDAKPNNWNENSSVFKYMKWNIGYFLYKFQRYDQLMTSDIKDSLNPFKSFSIIIGLINYPEIKNTSIDSQLNLYVEKYPDIMVKRVFIFNYSFDETNVCISPTSPYITSGVWEIFPPENKNEEGHSMVEIHLREVIGSIGKEFFNSIEKFMQLYYNDINNKNSSPIFPFLTTTFDENNPVDKSIIKKMNIPKRQIARLKKWMGDYCLQVCCLGDAMELYLSAINDLRSIVDHIWLSGALEGLAASILIVLKIGEPIEEYLGKEISVSAQVSAVSVEIAAFRLAEEKLNESISIISKFDVSGYCASQSCLRLAKTLSQVNEENYFKAFEMKRSSFLSLNDKDNANPDNNPDAGAGAGAGAGASLDALGNQPTEDTPATRSASPIQISGEENKNFINNLLDINERKSRAVDLINRAVGMQNLSKKQIIESYINGGEIFKSLHLFRKYILFFYKAATLFSEIEDIPSSVSLLITLANFMIKNYQHAAASKEQWRQRGNPTGSPRSPPPPSHCWTILMRNTLTLLTEQAVKTGDLRTASMAVAELIQILGESIEIYDRLCMNTKRGVSNSINPQYNTNFAVSSDASSNNTDISEDIPESRSTLTATPPSSSDKIYPDWGIYVSRSEQEKAWKYFLVNKIFLAKSMGKIYPSLLISLRPSQRSSEAFVSRENIQSAEQLKAQLSKGNSNNNSALFYDPFAARAALQRERDAVSDIYWTEGTVCKCVVMLQNIYEVSLLFEDIVVDWDLNCLHERDRIKVTPIPVSVCLPPKSPIVTLELKTYISVLSNCSFAGESNLNHLNNVIKIKGVEFSIHSSRVQISVNDKGFPVHKFRYLTQYDTCSPEYKIKSLHSTICYEFSKTSMDDGKEVLIPKLDSVQNTEPSRITSSKNIEKYQKFGEPNMKIFIVPDSPASIEIVDPVNKDRVSKSLKNSVKIELFEGEFKFINIIFKRKSSSELSNGNYRISMIINGQKTILQDLNEDIIGTPKQPFKINAINDRINILFSRDNIDSTESTPFQLLIFSHPNAIDNKIENEHLNFKLEIDVFIPKLYEADGSDNQQFKIFYKYSLDISLIHRGRLLSRSSQYLSTKSLTFSKNTERIIVSLLSKQNDKKTYENLTVNSIEHLHLNVFKNNLNSPVILFKDHNSLDAQNPMNYSSIIKFLENYSFPPSNIDNLESQVNMLCRFGPLTTITLPDLNKPVSSEEGGCLYWILKENSSRIHIGKFSDLNLSSSHINLNKTSLFKFNIDITSPLGNGKLYMRNEYELHLKGSILSEHVENHKLNYLEISFIIIEADYWNGGDEFDHNISTENFSPYGSKDVFITGQPRKLLSPKYFKSQKKNIDSNKIDLEYKLSLYFTKAGRYNILLLYNESFDLICEQESIDYSREECNKKWWILRKPIEII